MNKVLEDYRIRELLKERDKLDMSLDAFHFVNMSELNIVNKNGISNHFNARYVFIDLLSEFKYAYDFADKNECFNSISLLRSSFENLMYLIAVTVDEKLVITTETSPVNLRSIVKNHSSDIFGDLWKPDEIDEFYTHVSKMMHPSSVRESLNYLNSKSRYRKYIVTELKCEIILLEIFLMQFLDYLGRYNGEIQKETAVCSSVISVLNAVYLVIAFKNNHSKKINRLFYAKKSKKYLEKQKAKNKNALSTITKDKVSLVNLIEQSVDKLKSQYEKLGYGKLTIKDIKEKLGGQCNA